MPKYETRQRRALLCYLSNHMDTFLCAQEIADALREESVSLSSVYRNLAELETEGRVRRGYRGSGREVYYQFVDSAFCKGAIHLSCKRCGRTFHMDREDAQRLVDAVAKAENFSVDKSETVLYGVCETCQ